MRGRVHSSRWKAVLGTRRLSPAAAPSTEQRTCDGGAIYAVKGLPPVHVAQEVREPHVVREVGVGDVPLQRPAALMMTHACDGSSVLASGRSLSLLLLLLCSPVPRSHASHHELQGSPVHTLHCCCCCCVRVVVAQRRRRNRVEWALWSVCVCVCCALCVCVSRGVLCCALVIERPSFIGRQ
jgi:hypothetical protein